jgi:hypothetical protein
MMKPIGCSSPSCDLPGRSNGTGAPVRIALIRSRERVRQISPGRKPCRGEAGCAALSGLQSCQGVGSRVHTPGYSVAPFQGSILHRHQSPNRRRGFTACCCRVRRPRAETRPASREPGSSGSTDRRYPGPRPLQPYQLRRAFPAHIPDCPRSNFEARNLLREYDRRGSAYERNQG